MSDMAGKAARVAVERSGRLPRYNADQLLALNNQLPTTYFLIPNSSFLLFFLSVIFRAFMPSPEEFAREKIDKLLTECGWKIQNRNTINLSAARGVAIREALLKDRDEVDYLLFVDGKAIGTVEAKPEGHTLTGVEEQSGKYGKALLDIYPKWREPLPFAYESTGVETQFTNQLDPSPKSRNVFAFHKPETLLEWLEPEHQLNTRLTNLLTTERHRYDR